MYTTITEIPGWYKTGCVYLGGFGSRLPMNLRFFSAPVFVVVLMLFASQLPASAVGFALDQALNYALLFEGNGGNTLQITNVTINGNVGVGRTGRATDSGPSTINGAINFSASNGGQFSNNNGADVITGGVHYSVSQVTSALSKVNSLSATLAGLSGAASIAINGTQTVNASNGTLYTINGQSVHVFDATSFKNAGGSVLTIHGSANDLVAINLGGLGNIQFQGGIVFTGGITSDDVIFNIGGGDYTHLTGGASLQINNNGGKDGIAQGIFLDPNGAISVTNAVVDGRVFGGDTHDFQYVSGAKISCPQAVSVPDTGSSFLLLSFALALLVGAKKLFQVGA